MNKKCKFLLSNGNCIYSNVYGFKCVEKLEGCPFKTIEKDSKKETFYYRILPQELIFNENELVSELKLIEKNACLNSIEKFKSTYGKGAMVSIKKVIEDLKNAKKREYLDWIEWLKENFRTQIEVCKENIYVLVDDEKNNFYILINFKDDRWCWVRMFDWDKKPTGVKSYETIKKAIEYHLLQKRKILEFTNRHEFFKWAVEMTRNKK